MRPMRVRLRFETESYIPSGRLCRGVVRCRSAVLIRMPATELQSDLNHRVSGHLSKPVACISHLTPCIPRSSCNMVLNNFTQPGYTGTSAGCFLLPLTCQSSGQSTRRHVLTPDDGRRTNADMPFAPI